MAPEPRHVAESCVAHSDRAVSGTPGPPKRSGMRPSVSVPAAAGPAARRRLPRAALALLLLLLGGVARASDLQYKLEWSTVADGVQFTGVNPITKVPGEHAKVTMTRNGGTAFTDGCRAFDSPAPLDEGDLIPSTPIRWSTGGGTSVGSCPEMTQAGEWFYAFNYPLKSSSNAGYSDVDSLVIYMIIDDADNVYMVMSIDEPNQDGIDGTR